MKAVLAILFTVSLTIGPVNSEASSAWWVLCDACTSDAEFRYQALNAPGSYTPIYVTNRDSNETRKLDRWTSTEDFDGVLVKRTEVQPAVFPEADKVVFRDAVEGSNVVFQIIPRSNLAGAVPGIGNESSIVGDISNGSIPGGYISALRLEIERRNLLPTHESVNVQAGLNTPIAGGNYGQGGTIRKKDLVLVIEYDDGSTISVSRRPGGTFVNWEVRDSNESIVPLDGPSDSGTIPVDADDFGGMRFYFGGGRENRAAADALRDAIYSGSGGAASCTVRSSTHGISLTCPKIN